MVEHSSGYNAVMKLSESSIYQFANKTYNWLDVVHACYLVQSRVGLGKDWDANTITGDLRRLKPGYGYFPTLTVLVNHGILRVGHQTVGIGRKTEPFFSVIDPNGVALALRELGYLLQDAQS